MKIRAITLNNVRRFTDPAQVTGIGDGINVLSEPNEHGKSTLFDAIQALFFKPFGSRDKEVSALRPHAGGAPEVTIEVETEAGRFALHKRWFQKPLATVHREGKLIAQADEAEAWIAQLLGGDAGGPSGLIWVRQGMTALTGGSTKEEKLALEARRDLMTSVGAEVEAMTGGRRMDKALAQCREELAQYATSTGRPRTGGPWKEAQDQVEALTAARDQLAATARALQDALAERQRARRALAELEAPEVVAERREKLEAARAAHAAATRHAEEMEALDRAVELARLNADNATSRLNNYRAGEAEQKAARRAEAAAREAAEAARAALSDRRATLEAAEAAAAEARTALKAAEDDHRHALRARAARDGADRRQALEARIKEAEDARRRMESAAAAAKSGPDAAALQRLERLSAELSASRAARDAAAPQVTVRYAPNQSGAIHGNDGPLADGIPLPLPRRTTLRIDGIGDLEIEPGAGGGEDGSVDAATTRLQTALDEIGAADLAQARAAGAARVEAAARQGEAKAVLASLAPDGIDALHQALAAIPAPEEVSGAPDLAQAEDALQTAQAAHERRRIARETTAEALADAKADAAGKEAQLGSLTDRLQRAEAQQAKLGDVTEKDLAAQTVTTAAALEAARLAHAEKAKDAPDAASLQAALTRAESVETQAREEIARLHPLLARLSERITRASGDAVEERLAETEDQLQAAEAALARIAHEVAVLTRLQEALQDARNEARERYFTPIVKELKPLLQLLWPDAELTWGEESLLPHALIREGREEPIEVLSGGTQEQVALLVRLAFARMLARAGRIAPVILDDALVFTDDDRIERMFDALHRQAGDMQIIVLTCRQRAFRALGGQALRLQAVVP
ncbi:MULTISPECIES: AAA family ATPase [unclassified Sulfitobacter]|uniref:AAA family ATPase n=1 Tax=unclassified Sulfitobacter TaxID=196795 RepID=UPI0007C27683|nr:MULTISPECIES: AAA family ATPase [unclassified Sulfitobacter]KZY54258.1 chromosome segregation protein SMC [Sulfitobacter sp. HI0054]MBO9439400.1 AAA family ATPase [Sulfitobacter sp. R18_2]TKA85733.1 chromosome segregation protein SMC [Sulfitobacter sp. 15WGC]